MKILIKNLKSSISTHFIDAWYVYLQSLHDYNSPIVLTEQQSSADVVVLHDSMPATAQEYDPQQYDVVLLSNAGEPISVATPAIKELLKHPNVYFLANSLLDDCVELKEKTIWFPHNVTLCREYWTSRFYPQYYENTRYQQLTRKPSMIAINGTSRSWRHYFFELMHNRVPSISLLSTISKQITITLDSQWESLEDQTFRDWVNEQYDTVSPNETYRWITSGIDNKLGEIPIGYFLMPLYFENSCVIFPETSWQNHELCLTEKALKCFFAGSLPFPVGGAGVNKLYNQIGFSTAWNLLPPDLQQFDSIIDHRKRYQVAVDALAWLEQNTSVFESEQFEKLTAANRLNFLSGSVDYQAVEKFNQTMRKYL